MIYRSFIILKVLEVIIVVLVNIVTSVKPQNFGNIEAFEARD